MKQFRRIAGAVFVAASLCACVASEKPNSRTHSDNARRALMRASTLLTGEYNKARYERAVRELEIVERESELAKEAAKREYESAMRDFEVFNRTTRQSAKPTDPNTR